VSKAKIAANGDYNLSGERYREGEVRKSAFPLRRFEEVCTLEYGASLPKEKRVDGPYSVVGSNGITGCHNECLVPGPAIVIGRKGSAGEVTWIDKNCFPIDTTYFIKQTNQAETDLRYLYWILKSLNLAQLKGGAGIPGLNRTDVYEKHRIPLPPLEVQQEIVAEIEGYQKVIDGARAVLDNYRPHISIHPDWPVPTFEDAPFEIIDGDRGSNYPNKEDFSPSGYCLFLNTKNVRTDGFRFDELEFISPEKDAALRKGKLRRGDVLLTTRGTIGNTALYDDSVKFEHVRINSGMLVFRPDSIKLLSSYLFLFFQSENFKAQCDAIVSGAAQPQLPIRNLKEARIPLPPLATQKAIVEEIEAEQALVVCNRDLIARFEKKIQATLARVWGEEESASEKV
jgi:type I restriction enzyme M protein